MNKAPDTIAAIATPPGSGGIAILRFSGPEVHKILCRLFVPAGRNANDKGFVFRPRFMHYGHALDKDGRRLDEVLALYMPGPASVTGEDTGEIHCHAGLGVTSALLESAFCAGASPAKPGEFTCRAFLNGRMDLTQAEAVAELVNAKTQVGARLAAAKLQGSLRREIETVRETLESLRVQVMLAVDFPEEDAELLSENAFEQSLCFGKQSLQKLLDAFTRARFWREGASAVLCGRVNAGKSSLLNALLGRERAIVSAQPGTTRDYIEESINLDGLELRLIDTAGLRAQTLASDYAQTPTANCALTPATNYARTLPDNPACNYAQNISGQNVHMEEGNAHVENEGIARALNLAKNADLIIFLKDIRDELSLEEEAFLLSQRDRMTKRRIILVLNKSDLCDYQHLPEWVAAKQIVCPCVIISAKTGNGLRSLTDTIRLCLTTGSSPEEDLAGDLAPNLRQSLLIRKAVNELSTLQQSLADGQPQEIIALHLEDATRLLDEVSGNASNEDLLQRIFSTFCIGK
ncbi:MAG: tRNA modification GTPase [Desulfovibrio sp.]|jgi:tRNA modification GTPase|nr:tRNA modification GTPase [Desulfovibrio sp.]